MTRSLESTCQEGSNGGMEIDWQSVLSEYDRWLRTVVYSRLRDREATDEVMQDVALAAVRQASPLVDPAKVAPWLYRLAVRQVLLYRRKLGRRRKLTDQYLDRHASDSGPSREEPDALHWLLADERRSLVRMAMQRLPGRDLEILLLKYTENWSYQDIAARLGVSSGAVESRLHRARKRLRSELAVLEVIESSI